MIHTIRLGNSMAGMYDSKNKEQGMHYADYVKPFMNRYQFAKHIVLEPYLGVKSVDIRIVTDIINYLVGTKSYKVVYSSGNNIRLVREE